MWLFLKTLLFTVLVPGVVAGYLPWRLSDARPPPPSVWTYPALLCFAIGTAIYLWCAYDFGAAGRGTPAPVDAPKRLVVRGLYRYVRNPMYVGVLTVLAGWALLYQSAKLMIYALVVWLFFQLFVIFYEEAHLERLFGDEYLAYKAAVGRWLPRVTAQRKGP